MKASDLSINEYTPYYSSYISSAGNSELFITLKESSDAVNSLFSDISEEQMDYRYAEDKWTIKELLLHIIDVERVFAYRALRFSRKDKTDLPGFEHDHYVVVSNANSRSKASLLNEYNAQRKSTIALFLNFNEDMLMSIGNASGNPMSVRALGFVIAGHETHHSNIIKERYL